MAGKEESVAIFCVAMSKEFRTRKIDDVQLLPQRGENHSYFIGVVSVLL